METLSVLLSACIPFSFPGNVARLRKSSTMRPFWAKRLPLFLIGSACAFMLFAARPGPALAAPGDLDASFNGTGIVTTSIAGQTDEVFAVALQSDGKILVAGSSLGPSSEDLAVVRYTAEGALDTTFNTTGYAVTPINDGNSYAKSLAIQSDGKIVAAGYALPGTGSSSFCFALVRFDADGSLDATFDSDGIVTTPFSLDDAYIDSLANGVAIQPDGKIVAAGTARRLSDHHQVFAVIRYNADGSLDTGFGGGTGMAAMAIGPDNANGYALALQPDGKIVLAGVTSVSGTVQLTLARFNADGTPDTGFQSAGSLVTTIGTGSSAYAVAIRPDGRIVAGGGAWIDGNQDLLVARYMADGSLDTTFGSGAGYVTRSIGTGSDVVRSLAVQPDGRIAAGGNVHNGTDFDFAMAWFTDTGAPDTTFLGTGFTTTAIGSGQDNAFGLAIQSDGAYVLAGRTYIGAQRLIALTRYQGLETPIVTTTAATALTPTTAAAGGDVTYGGASPVTARGVCWGPSPGPETTGPHTTDGSGNGAFTSTITGLTPGSRAYVRAYAVNASGVRYGNEVTVDTTRAPSTAGALTPLLLAP